MPKPINQTGLSHLLLPIFIAVVVGVGGAFYIVASRANSTLPPTHGVTTRFARAPTPPDETARRLSDDGRVPPAYSPNWAGYVVSSSDERFTEVSAKMKVPAVSCTGSESSTFFWVGFDGYTTNSVEQAGIEAYCPARTGSQTPKVRYTAWWEMWPHNLSQTMPIKIHRGNVVFMQVQYRDGRYYMTVRNETTGKHFTKSMACQADMDCTRMEAEWVVERPGYDLSGKTFYQLTKWQQGKMYDIRATKANHPPRNLAEYSTEYYPIYMTNSQSKRLSEVTNPLKDPTSFFAKYRAAK